MTTYNQRGRAQLKRLCEALDLEREASSFVQLQKFLFAPWGDRQIPRTPPFPSWVGDDHSPYEYSIAFGTAGVELRLLLESQADKPTLRANQQAGLRLNNRLAKKFGIDLTRFD